MHWTIDPASPAPAFSCHPLQQVAIERNAQVANEAIIMEAHDRKVYLLEYHHLSIRKRPSQKFIGNSVVAARTASLRVAAHVCSLATLVFLHVYLIVAVQSLSTGLNVSDDFSMVNDEPVPMPSGVRRACADP